jgi:hypothetical protein
LEGHLEVFEIIINKYENLITPKHLESIEIGLKKLLEKVMIKHSDSQKKVAHKMILKKYGARVSVALKKYFQRNNLNVPKYINEWEESCLNKNEFSEVRRVWEDYLISQ